MSKKAPGRYCLAICYCGDCAHYKPMPRPGDGTPTPKKRKAEPSAWDKREDSTWIDKL